MVRQLHSVDSHGLRKSTPSKEHMDRPSALTSVNAEGRSMVRSTLGTRMTEVKSSWKPWKNRGKLDVFILEFCDEKCVA